MITKQNLEEAIRYAKADHKPRVRTAIWYVETILNHKMSNELKTMLKDLWEVTDELNS